MPPSLPRIIRAVTLALLAVTAGCRLEVRAPDAVPAETDRVEAVVASWYAATAAFDTAGWDRIVSPAATLLLPGSEPRLVPARVLLGIPGVRGAGAVRLVRAEARLDHGTATVRAIVARQAPDAGVEEETVDHLTLARMDSTWRVAHVVAGAWRRRGRTP